MRTVVVGPRPPEIEAMIARRAELGIDLFDEIWEGDYHVAPAAHGRHAYLDSQVAEILGPLARAQGLTSCGPLNLGEPDDYRVPDRALLREPVFAVFNPSAVLVVEIISPGDETYDKFVFYAAHGVEEILVVDPTGTVELFACGPDGAASVEHSGVLGVSVAEIAAAISWPP